MNLEQIIAMARDAAGTTSAQPTTPPVQQAVGQPFPPQQAYSVAVGQANGGVGAQSADLFEQDVRNLDPLTFEAKYGREVAQQVRNTMATQRQAAMNDATTPRNFSQTAADTVTDVGLGMANSLGGIAALGAGLVNTDAGNAVAGALGDLNEFAQSTQSPAMRSNRRLVAAETQLRERDNKKAMDDAIASGESEASAGIKRVLADIGSSVLTNVTNPTTLGSLVSQGVGSVLPVGPITGAAKLVGNSGLRLAVRAGALNMDEAAKIASIGSKASEALTIGGMESGGAFQQSVNQVMEMTEQQLMNGSPEYASLRESGLSHEEAKAIIANKAGLATAGYTAPFAIALGKTVARFEVDPLARVTVPNAARTVGLETFEEAGQGGAAQYMGNVAIQGVADKNQELTKGVGEQIGTGALAGAGLAAGLQTPGVIGEAMAPAMDKAATGLRNLANNLQPTPEPTKVTPTTSLPATAQQADSLVQQAPVMAERVQAEINASADAPEVKAQKSQAFQALNQAFAYSPTQFDELQAATGNRFDPALGEKLKGATNLAAAIQAVGDHLSSGVSDEVGVSTAVLLDTLMNQAENIAASSEGDSLINSALSSTTDPESKAFVENLMQVFTNMSDSKEYAAYKAKALEQLQNTAAPTEVNESTVGEIAARANFAPHTLQHKIALETILQAQQGKVNLSSAQMMRLQAAEALTRAMESMVTADGSLDPIAYVTRQVGFNTTKEDGQKYESVAEHVNNITAAITAGDIESAKANASYLRNLAETFNFKVAALNNSIAAGAKGDRFTYQNWAPSRGAWLESKDENAMWVDKSKPRSVRFANQVAAETMLAVGTYNNLLEQFSALEGTPLPLVQLDQRAKATSSKPADQSTRKPKSIVEKKSPGIAASAQGGQQIAEVTKKHEFKVGGKDPHTVTYQLKDDGRLSRTITFPDGESSTTELMTDKNGNETWVSHAGYEKGEFYPVKHSPDAATRAIRDDMEGKAVEDPQATNTAAPAPVTTTKQSTEPRKPGEAKISSLSTEEIGKRIAAIRKGKTPEQLKANTVYQALVAEQESRTVPNVEKAIKTANANLEQDQKKIDTSKDLPAASKKAEPAKSEAPNKELELVNAISKALGIPSIGSVENSDSVVGEYSSTDNSIKLNSKLKGNARLSVLMHETGHHAVMQLMAQYLETTPEEIQLMDDDTLLQAFDSVLPEVSQEYINWLNDRSSVKTRGATSGAVRVPLEMSAVSKSVFDFMFKGKGASEIFGKKKRGKTRTRNSSFHEWLADNVGKVLESNQSTQGIVGQFFKRIANAFKKMYATIKGSPDLGNFKPAASVEAWIEQVINGSFNATQESPIQAVQEFYDDQAETENTVSGTLERAKNLLPTKAGDNLLVRLFKTKSRPSRLSNLTGNPMDQVLAAFDSAEAFKQFTGSDKAPSDAQLANAKDYFSKYGNWIIAATAERFGNFLQEKAPYKEATWSRAEDILSAVEGNHLHEKNTPPEEWKNGIGGYAPFLNLVRNADGSVTGNIDDYFLEASGIAAAQYMLTAGGKGVAKYDEQTVANITGVEQNLVTDQLRNMVSIGLDAKDIVRGIAEQIEKVLGIEPKNDAPLFRAQGLPLSLAIQMFQTMEGDSNGSFFFDKMVLEIAPDGAIIRQTTTDTNGNVKVSTGRALAKDEKPRTITRYIPVKPVVPNEDVGFASVMEQALNVEPDNIIFFDKDQLKVSNTQLRSNVGITEAEKSAQQKQQETPHRLNPHFAKLLGKLDLPALQRMLGGEITEGMNENTAMSRKGKAITIAGSYNQALFVLGEIAAQATATGTKPEDLELFYKYETTATGRSMMQGKYNPQSDKVMRNLVMPMIATLDLTTDAGMYAWNLASIQMLGERAYAMTKDQVTEKAKEIFTSPEVVEAIKVLEAVLEDGDVATADIVQALEKASTKFEDGLTPESMHVLLDRARYNLSGDLTKFESRLYLEADGVANGPAGAMAMMTSDIRPESIAEFVLKMRKAGFFIGQPNQVMNQYRQEDKVDLYALSGEYTAVAIKDRLESYGDLQNQKNMQAHQTALLELLSGMFPSGAVSFNPTTNELVIKRGVTKNPLTVTVYGSGSQGIASKLLGIVEEKLYEQLSSGNLTNEVFADPKDFVNYLQYMVTNAPVLKEGTKGKYWTVERKASGFAKPLVPENYEKFTLTPQERKNLQDNIHHFFVKGMVKGIEQTVGPTVTGNRDLMVAATSVQTVMLQHAYQTELNKLYEKKQKENPDWDPVLDGLSKKDFAALEKSLSHLNIRLRTENQEWEVGNSEKAADDNIAVATSPDRKIRIPALIRKPGGAGVQVVPYLVIGMGDSAMVQNLFNDPDAPEGKLQVFDGINLGLNDIENGGEVVNRALANAWLKGNPLRAVADSLKKALALGDFFEALNGGFADTKGIESLLEKYDTPQSILRYLEANADKIDRLHAAIEKVGFASDQMAATGVTHSVPGTIDSTDEVDVANAIANEIAESRKEEAETVFEENQLTDSFTVIQGVDAVKRLVNSNFITDNDLRELANAALDTNGLTQLSDIKIVRGTAENLVFGQFVPEDMIESVLNGSTLGFWNPETNTLVLTDKATQETLAHELVHAATIQVLQAHAQNMLPTTRSGEYTRWSNSVRESITALEGILNDLLTNGWDVSRYSKEAQQSYQNMLSTIRREIGTWEDGFTLADVPVVQRMNALNELMAWTLSNRPVREMSKLQKFKQTLQMAIGLLKAVLFGKDAKAPRLNSSVFAQVQFHSLALMNAQGVLMSKLNGAARYANTTLQHSVGYGRSADVEAIGNVFQNKIGQYLAGRGSVISQIEAYVNTKAASNFAVNTQIAAQAAGFITTPQEASAYFKIVHALGTEAKINPVILNEAQALFRQAVKELTVESFLDNPAETDPAKLFAASDKLNFVLGKSGVTSDPSNRSSLLPNFIALGLVDPQMKKALGTIRTGRAKEKGGTTFDEKVTAWANNAMDSLRDRLVNSGRNPRNVEDALNSLGQALADEANRSENLIGKLATSANDVLDVANQFVVNAMEAGSQKISSVANNVATGTNNKYIAGVANTVSFTANALNAQGAKANAEAMIRFANKTALPEWISSIVKDLTGRLESQASVYDMIKIASNKVSKIRQFYKEHLPTSLKNGFKVPPSEAQWTAMFKGFAKTDLASLVRGANIESALEYLNKGKRSAQIAYLEKEISKANKGALILEKSKQLANYMVTGVAGPNLLRNADAVANLVTIRSSQFNLNKVEQPASFVRSVDELISLYALNQQSKEDIQELEALVRDDMEGVKKVLGVLKAQREKDQARRVGMARFNAVKGYIPSLGQDGSSIQVADDRNIKDMERKGYTRIADYTGSKIFAGTSMGYYFSPVSGKAPYNQGIIQNARMTAGGVDAVTGHAIGFPSAGRITQKATVDRLVRNMHLDSGNEALMPIVDATGKIVGFERSLDPAQLERLKPSTHLAKMLGQWMGRQAEEELAMGVNQDAVARAYAMWKEDTTRRDEYINVLDETAIKDPVMRDALSLLPREVKAEAERLFGKGKFMVRKDTFDDLFGYRDASFSDFWNGNSRWSTQTQERVRNALEGIIGKNALNILMTNEERLKNFIKDAKTLIVVKSVIVPAANMVANVFQIMASGVPLQDIVRGLRDKTLEVDSYMKSNLRKMDLTVELMAAEGNVVRTNKLKAQIKTIEDMHKRLSIWPLIEAGELGSISDVGISRDEILLTEGKLQEYIEAKTDKLPEGVKTLGKNFLLTKDTALFQGLQKSMEYGDFLAKAIVYDHLMKKGSSSENALGVITDEFVNYDRLPGRVRGSLENFGLAWFYNYKLRIAKTAFRMIRENPVRLALVSAIPVAGIETPVSENIFTKAMEGSLGYSLGPGMLFDSVGLNPWVNAMQ